MKKIFEDEFEIIEESNNIFFATYKTEIINIDIAKKLVKNILIFSQGKDIVVLINSTKTKNITKEARTYLVSEEALLNIKAIAFFSDNRFTSFIINFIVQVHLKINIIQTPIKIFNNKTEAIIWLENKK